ncbi:HAD family hydrolase [Chloroflexota bacterium]
MSLRNMDRITAIKAISFDGDGTLWDFNKVMHHSLYMALIELRKLAPEAAEKLDIEKMIEIRNRVAGELKGKVTNLEEVRLEAFKQTLKDIGRPDDAMASHLNELYLKHRFEDIELYEDVLPTLQKLREKYILGLLSNGNSYPERCGLEGIFEFVIFSQDYEVEKPDPRFYKIAIEKAGCSAEQILHIGDSLQNDVKGAANVGIPAVWLNRDRAENTTGIEPDYEINSLSGLFKILEENE